MAYAENKRRILAATTALILVLVIGLLAGAALASSTNVPHARLTAARASATVLATRLTSADKALTATRASARASQGRAASLSRQTARLSARIRAAQRCLQREHRDANRCVASALR